MLPSVDALGRHRRWLVSDEVRAVLGEDGLALLASFEQRLPLHCCVCGGEVPPSSRQPLSVVVASDRSARVVTFAHPDCCGPTVAGSVSLTALGSGDATAFFALRSNAPHCVLVFEGTDSITVSTGTETIDVLTAGYIAAGWTPATEDLLDLTPPVAPGWRLHAAAGQLALVGPDEVVAYEQDLTSEVAEWLGHAGRAGVCVAATATIPVLVEGA